MGAILHSSSVIMVHTILSGVGNDMPLKKELARNTSTCLGIRGPTANAHDNFMYVCMYMIISCMYMQMHMIISCTYVCMYIYMYVCMNVYVTGPSKIKYAVAQKIANILYHNISSLPQIQNLMVTLTE